MSYLVLARKYRPRSFSELVGQDHVVLALTNALQTQRLHHAYLFTGTRGVGKTTISRILAKSLNCVGADGQGTITAQPCGVCAPCMDIDAGRFVDYTELDAASNRGVNEVQELLEQAVYKPVQGRFKVFMIDEVHMLSSHAFNAMLKTLEEPPEYLKFVLATTDPHKVPVTVLSRCLQFNLRPMAPENVAAHLKHVLEAEQVQAEPGALRLLARSARGSMRDALSLTDQAIAFSGGRVEEAAVRQMLGSVDSGHVFHLIEALAAGDGKRVVEICDHLRAQGLSAASTLEDMTAVLQRMAVAQAVPGLEADAGDPDARETMRLAGVMPPDETQLLYSMGLHGRGELNLAPDEYAGLTMVLLRFLAFQPGAAEKKTLNDGARARAVTPESAPAVSAAPAAAPAAAPPSAPRLSPRAVPTAAADAGAVLAPASVRTLAQAAPAAAAPIARVSDGVAHPPGYMLPVREPGPTRSSGAGPHATSRVVGVPVRQQSEPGARTQAREEAPAATFTPTEEGAFWHATVQELVAAEAVTALVRELALQSQLVARDTDHWMLRVERESLNQPTSRERLCAALNQAGMAVKISVEVGAVVDSPARRNAAAVAERQRAAEAIILSDPFVQTMMRDFGAKIVPGSIKPRQGG